MRVVIPVKSFRLAKRRLADTLSPLQRERLAMLMATNVVAAANGYDIAIACDDNDVEKWARDLGADVIRTDGRDLNGSISLALADSRDSGWDGVAIVHSDLPLADSLDAVFDHFTGQVVLVPDVAMDGTNVMVVPTDRPIAFAYGPGSLATHIGCPRSRPDPPPGRESRVGLGHRRARGPERSDPFALRRRAGLGLLRRRPADRTSNERACTTMTAISTKDLERPERLLVIVAHPDDAEFQAGATLAKWSRLGSEVHHLVLTDGSKGTWDPEADPKELIESRKAEQRAAALALGATGEVHFLGLVDGELTGSRSEIALVAEVIRRVRPNAVLGHDPWRRYRLHPDHRRAGELCIEGIVAARDPMFFREQLVDGLEPHRPSALLLFEADVANHAEEVSEVDLQQRIAALEAFQSQLETTHFYGLDPEEKVAQFRSQQRDRLTSAGATLGVPMAELFHLITDQL